jgi:hypothetical protein
MEFPHLLTASRQHSLLTILEKIKIRDSWGTWTTWDKWCCIAVALSACVPIINLGCPEDSSELASCMSVFAQLLEAMGRIPPKLPEGVFGRILAENPEASRTIPNPDMSGMDSDNDSLPSEMEELEVEAEKTAIPKAKAKAEKNLQKMAKQESPIRKS